MTTSRFGDHLGLGRIVKRENFMWHSEFGHCERNGGLNGTNDGR